MPWGRLDDSLYDHPKLDLLPPEHRLEAVGLWARSISWCNRFLTDGHVPRERIAKLDGTNELADMLVVAGLYDVNGSGYIVHDFLEFNDSREQVEHRRKADAKRKADWREKRRHGVSHNGTPSVDDEDVPPGVAPSVRPESQRQSRGVSRDSRARSARESRPDPTRPDPSDSLHEENPRALDIAALRVRGWKRVTKEQRRVLAEIADRHRRDGNDGTWFAAEAIRNAPERSDPLQAVMAADRLWQEAQRKRADAEETAWRATKDQERRDAERLRPDRPDVGGSPW